LLLTLILSALVSSDTTDKQDTKAAAPATTTPATAAPPAKIDTPPAKIDTPPAKTGTTESNDFKEKPLFKGPAVISESLMHGSKVKFQSHNDPHPYMTYLQQTLDFNAVKHLYTSLQASNPHLQNRGDAHITVINPQEYDQVLSKAGVTMHEIERIALRHHIQSAKFTPLCMGRSRVNIRAGPDEVYFIVVKSPALVKIRQEVQKLYVKKGGEISLFQAEAFWPHITVAFTKSDVFLFPDQVFKGLNACVKPVRVLRSRHGKPHRKYHKKPHRKPKHHRKPEHHIRHGRHHE